MIIDASQRQRALDTNRSFAVTAPAGSGKTELLTQRYLALLAAVEQPENILAITFTRKAVAEMGRRVLDALADAKRLATENPDQPFAELLQDLPAHRRQTMQLANNALAADAQGQWHLLQSPSRLRIYTFDAFAASLTRQMPFGSGFGGVPQQSDDPLPFYQSAVDNVLNNIGSANEHAANIELLLTHLDCRADRLHGMLVNLLRQRDQWRALFREFSSDNETSMAQLRAYLKRWTEDRLEDCAGSLRPFETRLCMLLRFGAENLNRQEEAGKKTFYSLPPINAEHLGDWHEVAEFLLTRDYRNVKFRAKVDKRQGFPPKSTKPAPEFSSADFRQLADDIEEGSAEAASKLHELRLLPKIESISAQEPVLNALLSVMRLAMAHLELEFQQRQQVDFPATSMRALLAIEDASDLALRLDYQLRHLLVDEFQDTSQIQYDLLSALCAEWFTDPEANRSMFFVGDAMQSIYSFRNARVGLFMHVRKHGLANYPLEELQLQSNFRSQAGVVDWFNQCFAKVFPLEDDLQLGACSYVSAYVPADVPGSESGRFKPVDPEYISDAINGEVQCFDYKILDSDELAAHSLHPRHAEAQKICGLIQQAKQRDPAGTIAVLVRSRAKAEHLFDAFRAANIDWNAADFERLNTQAAVADISNLARIYTNPADQIAWYSVLRSPLIGLELNDLWHIAQCHRHSAWDGLCLAIERGGLSESGALRVAHFAGVYRALHAGRQRKGLAADLRGWWQALGGSVIYSSDIAVQFIEQYLDEVAQLESSRPTLDWETLSRISESVYGRSTNQNPQAVQLMTMHKAKGLEFDTVILPALDATSPSEPSELLSWQSFVAPDSQNLLLLGMTEASANRQASSPPETAYDYVRTLKARQRQEELARLMYVACTRAAKQLYLFRGYHLDADGEQKLDRKGSLAALIWPHLPADALSLDNLKQDASPTKKTISSRQRLTDQAVVALSDMRNSPSPTTIPGTTTHRSPEPVRITAEGNVFERSVGIVVHRSLERKVLGSLPWQDVCERSVNEIRWRTQLRQQGLRVSMEEAVDWVEQTLLSAASDEDNQWLFDSSLDSSAAEYELHLRTESGGFQALILDRTFVDATNTRWIIDYKVHLDHSTNQAQLQALAMRHRKQLKRYLGVFPDQPCKAGVYFVLQKSLIELAD